MSNFSSFLPPAQLNFHPVKSRSFILLRLKAYSTGARHSSPPAVSLFFLRTMCYRLRAVLFHHSTIPVAYNRSNLHNLRIISVVLTFVIWILVLLRCPLSSAGCPPPLLSDSDWSARLTETSLVTHYRQYYPSFYIKAEGEVDLAYISKDRFWPVEVKWRRQLRAKDLKQISKYRNALILTKSTGFGHINDIPTQPLPLVLLRLGAKERPEVQI